jgi:hypothetical protein
MILCSYSTIKLPNVLGVNFWNRIEFVGRFPSNTLLFNNASFLLLSFCTTVEAVSASYEGPSH